MGMAEFVPLKPTQLSFWEKMLELQYKMLIVNQENIEDHIYSCDSPLDWILLTKGIAYWISPESNVRLDIVFGEIYYNMISFSVSNTFDWQFSVMVLRNFFTCDIFFLVAFLFNEKKTTS